MSGCKDDSGAFYESAGDFVGLSELFSYKLVADSSGNESVLNDTEIPYTQIAAAGDCVRWGALKELRTAMNTLHDLLDNEGRAEFSKYGGDDGSMMEEIEDLATVEGFFSVKLNHAGDVEEIYFRVTGGTIHNRIPHIGETYSYAKGDFGQWIVYLKDACFGCTGFAMSQEKNSYPRSVVCNGEFLEDLDPVDSGSTWFGWNIYGGTAGGETIDGASDMCNLNIDWRDGTIAMDTIGAFAQSISRKYAGCYASGSSCDGISVDFCCYGDTQAIVHLTEEGGYGDCPDGEVYRWAKWVDIGGPGYFKGFVTQTITALHLNDMWENIKAISNLKSRVCQDGNCYPQIAFGDTVDVDKISATRIIKQNGECGKCDDSPAVDKDICACHWNELLYVIKFLSRTCTNESGDTFLLYGDDTKSCCPQTCCMYESGTVKPGSAACLPKTKTKCDELGGKIIKYDCPPNHFFPGFFNENFYTTSTVYISITNPDFGCLWPDDKIEGGYSYTATQCNPPTANSSGPCGVINCGRVNPDGTVMDQRVCISDLGPLPLTGNAWGGSYDAPVPVSDFFATSGTGVTITLSGIATLSCDECPSTPP